MRPPRDGRRRRAREAPARRVRHAARQVVRRRRGALRGRVAEGRPRRAFMRDTLILVLDEPTSALDPQAEFELFARLRELSHGRTAVYISHRFSTVRQADRILFLERGRVVEEGSHDELIALGASICAAVHAPGVGLHGSADPGSPWRSTSEDAVAAFAGAGGGRRGRWLEAASGAVAWRRPGLVGFEAKGGRLARPSVRRPRTLQRQRRGPVRSRAARRPAAELQAPSPARRSKPSWSPATSARRAGKLRRWNGVRPCSRISGAMVARGIAGVVLPGAVPRVSHGQQRIIRSRTVFATTDAQEITSSGRRHRRSPYGPTCCSKPSHAQAVDEDVVVGAELGDGPAHREVGGVVDVQPVDLDDRGRAHADRDRTPAHDRRQRLALGGRQGLRVTDAQGSACSWAAG